MAETTSISSLCIQYLKTPSMQPTVFIQSLESLGLTGTESETTARTLLIFFRLSAKKVLSRSKFEEDLNTLGFPHEATSYIGGLWDSYKVPLCQALLGEMVRTQQLVDMEWKLGVTLGNMLTDRKGDFFLQIKMTVKTTNGELKDIYCEMTPVKFYELYGELEKIQAVMEIHSN